MKLFVAGATGAVGRLLVPLLVRDGHEVAGATRTPAGAKQLESAGARAALLDVLDRNAVMDTLQRVKPGAVIHQLTDLAAMDLEANARLRIVGTRNLVDAARAAGVQRMVAQSIAFAYAPGPGPAQESDPLDRDAPMPRHRTVEGVLALESAVGELPQGVVLRYGTLYGPGTWYFPRGAVAEALKAGKLQAAAGTTSFLHVEDAALAAAAALAWPAGTVNIVDDEPAAAAAWVPLLAGLLGVPPPALPPAGETWARGARNARARGLGWRPRWPSWRDGFRDVFRYHPPQGESR
jgi:nucleoside-diphosphate-sugar epimerase